MSVMQSDVRPELQVAAAFMARKGYPKASPVRERRIDDPDETPYLWEFEYLVSNGRLTIEVAYENDAWDVSVVDYERR